MKVAMMIFYAHRLCDVICIVTRHNLVHSKLKWDGNIYEGKRYVCVEFAIRSLKHWMMDVNLHCSPVQCLAPKHPTKCAVVLQTNL